MSARAGIRLVAKAPYECRVCGAVVLSTSACPGDGLCPQCAAPDHPWTR